MIILFILHEYIKILNINVHSYLYHNFEIYHNYILCGSVFYHSENNVLPLSEEVSFPYYQNIKFHFLILYMLSNVFQVHSYHPSL
jgi:hypothetical protein